MIADINLLPKRERRSAKTNLLLYITLALFLLIGLYLFFIYSSEKNKQDTLIGANNQLVAEADQVQAELDGLQASQDESRDLTIEYLEYVTYPVAPIIDDVINRLSKTSYLLQLEFLEGITVLHIDFEDKTAVALYVEDLSTNSMYTSVHVTNVESFDPSSTTEDEKKPGFGIIVPRYNAEIELKIDQSKLASLEVIN